MRVTALLVVVLFVISLFSACGNAVGSTVTQSAVETTTVAEVVAATSTSVSTSGTTFASEAATTTTTTTTTASTTATTKAAGASWYKDAAWNEDGVLKILAVGNSFSQDGLKHVFDVAVSAGIYDIQWGNLFIGSCSLATHLENVKADSPSYTYYTSVNSRRESKKAYKLSDAVKSENWDFITFQQVSTNSGVADTYDDLEELISLVAPLCTNDKVEFAWHMTWAYQTGAKSLGKYGNDQMQMYNAIVSAVQNKVVPNERISKIIPNGTAIQNARTSYMGDAFTRDGTHLSLDTGCLIAAMTVVHALVGIDWKTFDYEGVSYIYPNKTFPRLAAESVRNAINTPFKVTRSSF